MRLFYLAWCFTTIAFLVTPSLCMKTEDFKTCSDSAFCRRHRIYTDDVMATTDFQSPYTLMKDSLRVQSSGIVADVLNVDTKIVLTLEVNLLEDNTARVRVNEKNPIRPRFDNFASYTLYKGVKQVEGVQVEEVEDMITLTYGESGDRSIRINENPLRIDFLVNDVEVVTLNERGFFHFEHLRTKESHVPRMTTKTNEDGSVEQVEHPYEEGIWEENFKKWTDPKPNGPESLGLDITFHGYAHVYGIPEHATSLSLKETRGGEGAYTQPYRLFNLDVFEYDVDVPSSLYGSVPLMMAHKKGSSVGVFWMNPSETWVDVTKTKGPQQNLLQKALNLVKSDEKISTQTHWFSEAGIIDLFVFTGPSLKDVVRQYTSLTGTTTMPPLFSIGYHQSRWNYVSEKDVLGVDEQFDQHGMPYDVIWLDIEYTDDKKYFTWDEDKFADPVHMEEKLDEKGRKLVIIVDPHIKRTYGYSIADEASKQGLFVKTPEGEDYQGWCWPGQSSWIDFVNPAAVAWYKEKYKFENFPGTRENVHLWNDMNEPSVFSGPEISMERHMIHHGDLEHRLLHNIYGVMMHEATALAVRDRTPTPKRPFVLSRAFYAGTQRHGAIWTGDNMVRWDALYYAQPMNLVNGLVGIAFTGADAPGFFGEPTPELMSRWYQAAIYQPFFRGHAHLDTKRREPYLLDEPHRSIVGAALRERYCLLPFMYTLFYDAYKTGVPVMRPMVMEFPDDESLFATEDQFMLGDAILIKPVTEPDTVSVNVYLAGDQPWYDAHSLQRVSKHGKTNVATPLNQIPVYYRGGHIVPRRERPRRSTHGMKLDPFTLVVALDQHGQAQGKLYVDDGESYDYESSAFGHVQFEYKDDQLSCNNLHPTPEHPAAQAFAKEMDQVRIERIRILGASKPHQVAVDGQPLEFNYDDQVRVITIKDPKTPALSCGWTVQVTA